MYTTWEIETQNLWLTQMPSQGEMADRKIFVCLSTYRLLWNNLWSVSRYVMGPLSGRWRQSGNDQQCLAAPIWKYRSGFGDHRFTFFIDLRPNYTFYTNLTNIVHWVVAYRDMAHLVRLNLGKSWEKSAKSFDAGLSWELSFWCSSKSPCGTPRTPRWRWWETHDASTSNAANTSWSLLIQVWTNYVIEYDQELISS